MDKVILEEYPNKCWGVAKVFKNGTEIADISLFYDVTPEWIFIYKTAGGSGTGFRQGDLIEKIFIGDCEFKRVLGG